MIYGISPARGFTLIEMSIVLVIIAVITVSVLMGRDLIRQAELKSVTSFIKDYERMITTYRIKYKAWPGDHRNAHDYFDDGTNQPCGTNQSEVVEGCNGNGDGEVNIHTPEDMRAPQHLNLAGILPGSYTGRFNGAHVPGVNVIASKLSNVGYQLAGFNHYGRWGNAVRVGKLPPSGFQEISDGAVTPFEAYQLDKKSDDGEPTTGGTIAVNGVTKTRCLNGNAYDMDEKELECTLLFWFSKHRASLH